MKSQIPAAENQSFVLLLVKRLGYCTCLLETLMWVYLVQLNFSILGYGCKPSSDYYPNVGGYWAMLS